MRILLDTNIFIPLEDSSIAINEKLAELHKITSGKHELWLHPATLLDLARDKNQERRENIIPRLKKYLQLKDAPNFESGEEQALMGEPKTDNDHVDNLILLALKRNCVHWLITEDNKLHKKAKAIGEQERVLRIDQAINALLKLDVSYSSLYPNIEDIFCYSIDLKNPFFDSLRKSYNFDIWFNEKCAQAGRKAWICREKKEIYALCIYKEELNPIVTYDKKALAGKVLKLCTFKVAKQGYKIGELLLKQAFNYAILNQLVHIYLTIEPHKHERLDELVTDFGFYRYGTENAGRDIVFVKDFPSDLPQTSDTPLQYAIKFFPFIRISTNSVYIVPIQPHYHQILFPELHKQTDLLSYINSAGNTIKKAYLCHASSNALKPGDILFFYQSQDEMAVTSYAIVDEFYIENDFDNIFKWVAKRTVFSEKEIKELACKEVKIILFRLIGHLDEYISFDQLVSQKIVKGSIQSITKISKNSISKLIHHAKLNHRVLSD